MVDLPNLGVQVINTIAELCGFARAYWGGKFTAAEGPLSGFYVSGFYREGLLDTAQLFQASQTSKGQGPK